MKRLPLRSRIALYSVTTAIAAAWFLVQNAKTLCAMCQDHMHYGFPFPYMDVGSAVANRYALLLPGAIADATLIQLRGTRVPSRQVTAIIPDELLKQRR